MKTHHLLTTLTLVVVGFFFMATEAMATPAIDTLNVQGYMKKANGTAVTDGTYTMYIGVFQNGTALWAKQYAVAVANGLFSQTLSSTGTDLSSTAPVGTGMRSNFAATTLSAALLSGATAGEVMVRVYSATAIDGANPQFDITLGATPTAMVAALAQGVEAGSISVASLAASAKATTGGAGNAGRIPLLDATTGLLDTTMLPSIDTTTGLSNGSITGSGAVTYKGAAGSSTTIGDNTSTSSTVIQSGTGGISETVAGATGGISLTAGTGSGSVTVTPGSTGTVTVGNAASTGDMTLQTGSGNLLLSPTTGVVRVTKGGLNLVNGAGTATINSAASGSWSMTLPTTAGTSNYFLQTDGAGVTTWADAYSSPGAIGATTPNTGAFTTVSATGQITSTVATGTPPFVVASTTNIPNLNASSLNGADFGSPGTIGGTTPGAGTFTTLAANTSLSAATVTVGGATSSAKLTLPAGTATANTAPLKFTSGTNLTTAEAGAVEYDGSNFFATADTTTGRGVIPAQQMYRQSAAGVAIGPAANFYFGGGNNIPLVANATYEIEIYCYYLKTTAGTVTWTLNNSAAPTGQNIFYEMSPATGIVAPPGAASMLAGEVYNDTTAAKTIVTASLTTGVNHYAHFKILLNNGTGTSLQLKATESAGTITPGIGSYWIARRLPTSSGNLAP